MFIARAVKAPAHERAAPVLSGRAQLGLQLRHRLRGCAVTLGVLEPKLEVLSVKLAQEIRTERAEGCHVRIAIEALRLVPLVVWPVGVRYKVARAEAAAA